MREFTFKRNEKPGDTPVSQEAPGIPAVEEAPGGATEVSSQQTAKKYLVPIIASVIGFGAIGLFAAFFHHPVSKQPTVSAISSQQTKDPATNQPATNSLPTDQNQQAKPADASTVSSSVVQGTRTATTAGESQALSTVPAFDQPATPNSGAKLWEATPYALSANNGQAPQGNQSAQSGQSSNAASTRLAQVSKPSLSFVSSRVAATGAGLTHSATEREGSAINNLGYQPGDHIATHLEAAATTATKAPVIAVVDFNYQRHGVTVIPAGTRIIGTVGQASSTGIMDIVFSTLHLPNGEDVSISAIALDTKMGPLKGIVTGKNIGKQVMLAALAGIGASTALFAGNNNVTGTISQGDLIRGQAAQNLGQAADEQIQQLTLTQKIVVTAPAGTQVEVTFISPAKSKQATAM